MSSISPTTTHTPAWWNDFDPELDPPVETKNISFAESTSEFFENLLDIVNPLQHIPGVSTLYRAITGDEIGAPARLIGGALFGGPVGFASATANLLLEEISGDDLAGHALALVRELDGGPELADATAAFNPLAEDPEIDLTAPAVESETALTSQTAVSAAAPGDEVEIVWNGPRIVPSLTATPAAAGDKVEIAWNGPRVLSSRTGTPAVAAGAAVVRPVDAAQPPQTGAAAPAAPAQPAWLQAAIADAQAVHGAAQTGQLPQKVEGQPWITDAMLEALNKYQALTRERNQ